MDSDEHFQSVAMVAANGRFPGADSLEDYWANILNGVESIYPLTKEDIAEYKVNKVRASNPDYIASNTSLAGLEYFDADFFDMTSREASVTDPQHRLLLEHTHALLRSIAVDPTQFCGDIGLFLGVGMSQYLLRNLAPDFLDASGTVDSVYELGNYASYAASRIAHKLNIRGPVLALDTACSSSLVAVHLACKSLLSFESDLAIAGGVQLNLPETAGYINKEGSFYSEDGHCYSFDSRANGTVFSSGLGLVALKRYEDAIEEGDRILAVIKGSAMNNDGSDKVGFSAPCVEGQRDVILKAQAFADVEAESISYVEAHGTATSLGDAIELSALTEVWGNSPSSRCALGTVKPNIGHLETAAGIAGLIKTVCALKSKMLPPNINFDKPNENSKLAESKFYINTEPKQWPEGDTPRRAGVSSFGMGGSNAHIVLEEFISEENSELNPSEAGLLLTLSAHNDKALSKLAEITVTHIEGMAEGELGALAYSLVTGSPDYSSKKYIVARNRIEAIEQLEAHQKVDSRQKNSATSDHVTFMFPGQGSQAIGMAEQLYKSVPLFRETFNECAEILSQELNADIRDIVFSKTDKNEELLNNTAYTQPILFSVEYSLAKLWEGVGVTPDIMIGHSLGDYVAASISGVFELKDALKVVAKRGELISKCSEGAMLSVRGSRDLCLKLIDDIQSSLERDDHIDLAAANAPESCVVSGTYRAIGAIEKACQSLAIKTTRLKTSHAFHSSLMEPCLGEFKEFLDLIDKHRPGIPFVSNITGKIITDSEATSSEYWCHHIRAEVNFELGLEHILKVEPNSCFVEVGPGRQLSQLAMQARSASNCSFVRTLPRVEDDSYLSFLNAVGELWILETDIDLKSIFSDKLTQQDLSKGGRIPLPPYPYQRQRYWVDYKEQLEMKNQEDRIRRKGIEDWFYTVEWSSKSTAAEKKSDSEQQILLLSSETLFSRKLLEPKFTWKNIVDIPFIERSEKEWQSEILRVCYDNPQQIIIDLSEIVHSYDDLERVFFRLLNFIKSTSELKIGKHQIFIVTSSVYSVTNEKVKNPLMAVVNGFVKVINLEIEDTTCWQIDIPENAALEDLRDWKVFKDEIDSASLFLKEDVDNVLPTHKRTLAVRFGKCWMTRYEPLPLQKVENFDLGLKKDGAYLVVGGFGGIGSSIARSIAKNSGASIILTTRPRPEKSNISNEDEKQRTELIKELSQYGSEVEVVEIDLLDELQTTNEMHRLKNKYSKINGIFHAIGVAGVGLSQRKDRDDIVKVIQPKVLAAWHLTNQFNSNEVDFVVFNSSLISITGGLGQLDYCGANSILDSLATSLRQRGVRSHSINWDGWKETGMATKMDGLDLSECIDTKEGIDALWRVIAANKPQVVVSTFDLKEQIEKIESQRIMSDRSQDKETSVKDNKIQIDKDGCEDRIARIWRQHLGLDHIGMSEDFFSLGGNSLILSDVLSDVKLSVDSKLSITDLFKYPTIRDLTDYIQSMHSETKVVDDHGDVDARIEKSKNKRQKQRRRRLANIA